MSIDELQRRLESAYPEDIGLEAFRFFLEKAKQEVIDECILQAEINDYIAANSQFGVGA